MKILITGLIVLAIAAGFGVQEDTKAPKVDVDAKYTCFRLIVHGEAMIEGPDQREARKAAIKLAKTIFDNKLEMATACCENLSVILDYKMGEPRSDETFHKSKIDPSREVAQAQTYCWLTIKLSHEGRSGGAFVPHVTGALPGVQLDYNKSTKVPWPED